ncbi:MAG: radical SAM protein [Planctomycetota bacterium]
MKVLIASAPHADTFGYSMPPPGLLRLGAAARDAGIDVALDDLSYRLGAGELGTGEPPNDASLADRCARHLAARCAGADGAELLVGLSTMGATLPIALATLERLRPLLPGARFVLGGPGVHGVEERLIERFAAVDVVVRGEAEITLVEFVAALTAQRSLEGVAGLVLRAPDGRALRTPDRPQIRDLGALPDYAWDLLPPIADYKALRGEEDGLVPLDSGRGCVYDCSFCSIGRTWSRRSRPLPAARLADEIEALRGIEGARRAYLCHDIFGADRRHALELCAELEARGTDVPWEVRARVDHLDDELLAAMGRAGCDRVLLGIESAARAVRDRNQKGMRADVDVPARIAACVENGVTPILSLILGLPGEDEDALEASLDLCARAALHGGVQVSLHLVNPQPGCALGEELGDVSRPVVGVPPDMALGAGDTPEERALIDAHPDLFSTWALLPMEPEELALLRFLKDELSELLMRFPRTFAALRRTLGAAPDGPGSGRGNDARALDVALRWRDDGRTFETFARAAAAGTPDESLVRALLDWEVALVRVAARGPRRALPDRWRAGGELVEADRDLPAAGAALLDGDELPGQHGAALTFAVAVAPVRPGGLPRVRTLRLGAGAAQLARALEAQDPAVRARAERALRTPNDAVAALVSAGVLVPPGGARAPDGAAPSERPARELSDPLPERR